MTTEYVAVKAINTKAARAAIRRAKEMGVPAKREDLRVGVHVTVPPDKRWDVWLVAQTVQ